MQENGTTCQTMSECMYTCKAGPQGTKCVRQTMGLSIVRQHPLKGDSRSVDYYRTACIRHTRVPDYLIKITGSCVYLAGSWSEATPHFIFKIRISTRRLLHNLCSNNVFFINVFIKSTMYIRSMIHNLAIITNTKKTLKNLHGPYTPYI